MWAAGRLRDWRMFNLCGAHKSTPDEICHIYVTKEIVLKFIKVIAVWHGTKTVTSLVNPVKLVLVTSVTSNLWQHKIVLIDKKH